MKHSAAERSPARPELKLGRHAFGADPAAYDAARRDYPPELFDLIAARVPQAGRGRAFEIGPGTGKATAPMLAMGLGHLTAVEPDPRLAVWLRTRLPDPRLHLAELPFEEADLEEGSFDLGYAATSFHWLDASPALARVARLLKPGGQWVMWWNVYQDPDRADAFRDRVAPLLQELRGQAPSFWGEPKDVLPQAMLRTLDVEARVAELAAAGFREIEARRLHWEARFDAAGIRALYDSFSFMREVPPDAAKATLDRIAGIAEAEFGGDIRRACVTQIYMAENGD